MPVRCATRFHCRAWDNFFSQFCLWQKAKQKVTFVLRFVDNFKILCLLRWKKTYKTLPETYPAILWRSKTATRMRFRFRSRLIFASKSPPLQVLKKCDSSLTARTQLLPYTRISDEELGNALEDRSPSDFWGSCFYLAFDDICNFRYKNYRTLKWVPPWSEKTASLIEQETHNWIQSYILDRINWMPG